MTDQEALRDIIQMLEDYKADAEQELKNNELTTSYDFAQGELSALRMVLQQARGIFKQVTK